MPRDHTAEVSDTIRRANSVYLVAFTYLMFFFRPCRANK
jgi:hypothetical protein